METPRNTGPLVVEYYLTAAWPNGWEIRDARTDRVYSRSDDQRALAARVAELNGLVGASPCA